MKLIYLAAVCATILIGDVQPAPAQSSHSQSANRSPCYKATDGKRYKWIDAKTGEPVSVYPQGTTEGSNPNERSRPSHTNLDGSVIPGKDFVRGPDDNTWIDAKTGEPVNVYPQGTTEGSSPNERSRPSHTNLDGSVIPGKDFVRVPCEEEAASSTTGGVKTAPSHAANGVYLGGESPEGWGRVTPGPPMFQLGVGYNFMRTEKEDVKNLNGFQVSAFVNVTPWLALGAQGSGLFGADSSGGADVTLQRYLYLFGPQVTVQPFSQLPRVSLTGHVLVGGVHDENRVSFGGMAYHSSANAFAMSVGTGVDVRVAPHVTVGPWMDYAPTAFTAPGTHWQNNWSAGFQVRVKF